MSILDRNWKYVKSGDTNISVTLKRAGFRQTTQQERDARQKRSQEPPAEEQPVDEKRKVRAALRLAGGRKP